MQITVDTGVTSEWSTCADKCLFILPSYQELYLKCYADDFGPCESKSECESAGECSDREWTTFVQSYDYPYVVQKGACFSSGYTERVRTRAGA